MKRRTLALAALTGAGAGYGIALRLVNWQRCWGATEQELTRAMPGDDIVTDADYESTRAVTVLAEPRHIWPWLAQMGYRRGGLYSYDALDMLFGFTDRPSSQAVLPEFQELHAGDIMPIGRGGSFYVHRAERDACLVIGPEDRSVPISWSTAFFPQADASTRLVTRVRGRMRELPGGPVAAAATDVSGFIMVRRWLLNLKQRAERLAASDHVVPISRARKG